MCEKYRVDSKIECYGVKGKFDENISDSKNFVEQIKPKIFPPTPQTNCTSSDFLGDTYGIKCNKYSTCMFTYQNVLFRKSNDTLSLTSSKR